MVTGNKIHTSKRGCDRRGTVSNWWCFALKQLTLSKKQSPVFPLPRLSDASKHCQDVM